MTTGYLLIKWVACFFVSFWLVLKRGRLHTHPTIAKSWRNNWVLIIPLFSYPPDIRKAVSTTNAIESLNMSLRKGTKNRGQFPNDEAMFKLLYLALRNIAKKWSMPIRDWKSVLNQFTIIFENRMPSL